MPRVPAFLVLALAIVVAACGDGSAAADDGAASASAAGAGPVTNGAVPPGSSVYFGSAYDPATFAVADRTTRIKVGDPIVAVGKALSPVDGSTVQVRLEAGGRSKPLRPPTAMDDPAATSFFATDLTPDALGPGTWIVSFVNANNRVIASAFLTVAP